MSGLAFYDVILSKYYTSDDLAFIMLTGALDYVCRTLSQYQSLSLNLAYARLTLVREHLWAREKYPLVLHSHWSVNTETVPLC